MKDKKVVINNPVAQYASEFCKPKTFRDRKKHVSKGQQREDMAKRIEEMHHPLHTPYARDSTWKKEVVLEDDDFISLEEVDEGDEVFDYYGGDDAHDWDYEAGC